MEERVSATGVAGQWIVLAEAGLGGAQLAGEVGLGSRVRGAGWLDWEVEVFGQVLMADDLDECVDD